jgi:group I intron endonuclease
MTIGIYKITNNINGMFYIGQSIDIDKRWIHHNCVGSQCVKIRNALRKYGKDNFTLSVLEELSREQLTEREQFYLDALDPFGSRGYNICRKANAGPGNKGVPKTGKSAKGAGNKNNVPVECFDENGKKVAEYHNVLSAAEAHNIDKMGIFNCLAGRSRVAAGLFWSRKGELPNIRQKQTKKGQTLSAEQVLQMSLSRKGIPTGRAALNRVAVTGTHTLTGETVTYDSMLAAGSDMGVSLQAIRAATKTGITVKGYSWQVTENPGSSGLSAVE